jgi:hypothetical protein
VKKDSDASPECSESLTFVEDIGPVILRLLELGKPVWNQVLCTLVTLRNGLPLLHTLRGHFWKKSLSLLQALREHFMAEKIQC